MMPGDQLTPVTMPRARRPLCRRASRRRSRRGTGCRRRRGPRPCDSRSSPSRSRRAWKRASKWSRPMMPSMAGLTGLECSLHRVEQRPQRPSVDGVVGDQARQRRARQPGRLEHRPLLGGAGEAAELRDELAHGAVAPAVGVMHHIGGDQPGSRSGVYQCGEVGSRRLPLLQPGAVAAVVAIVAAPVDGQRQVRVEPGVVVGDL